MNCEFSLDHYIEILQTDPKKFGSVTQRRQIILAHDVDLLPKYALAMAEVEAELGVSSTYYILPYADFYNATSPANIEIWNSIHNMGHELGFHYDGRYAPDLDIAHRCFKNSFKGMSNELALHLNGLTPQPPIPAHLHDRRTLDKEGYTYLADSGGWWRTGCVCRHLDKKLTFVCHPIWWSIGTESLRELEGDSKNIINDAIIKWEDLIKVHRETGKNKH